MGAVSGLRLPPSMEVAPWQRRGIAGVQSLGFHPLFDHIRLVEAKGSDWLIFPMEQDTICHSGQFPTPLGVL